jgi:hypothetical protein
MRKHTFTIFNENDTVYGYLFDVTRLEAQATVSELNSETGEKHYYMEGFLKGV